MRRHYVASPLGRQSGLFFRSGDESRFSAVVYPKPWGSDPGRHFVWDDHATDLIIAVPELTVFSIDASPERHVLLVSESETPQPTSDVPPLISVARRTPGNLQATSPVDGSKVHRAPTDWLLAIDNLMRRSGLGSLTDQLEHGLGWALNIELLRPLLYRRFVEAVESVVHTARRGYSWREESLSAIRGRPDPTSVVLSERTGWPLVDCRFEEFSRDTPLLLVVCAALVRVAKSSSTSWTVDEHLDTRAIRLRRTLGDVPDIPPTGAFAIGTRIQLNVFDGHWAEALRMALAILAPLGGMSPDSVQQIAVELQADTARIWERILHEGMLTAGVTELLDGNASGGSIRVARPWARLGGRPPAPDFAFRTAATQWIADAKYKLLAPNGPSIDDLYQLFAYSYLTAEPRSPSELALLYPTSDGTESQGPFVREPNGGARIRLLQLPFPSPSDLRDWTEYRSRLATAVSLGLSSAQAEAAPVDQ